MGSTAIVWFRRDLRLNDQPALSEACRHHEHVIPVYIHDPAADGAWAPGAASRWWLHHSLKSLAGQLAACGSRLIIRSGDSRKALTALLESSGATALYFNRLYEPARVRHDASIEQALRAEGFHVQSFAGAVLFEPWQLMRTPDQPYRVFTPYWNRMQRDWSLADPYVKPARMEGPAAWPETESLEQLDLLPTIAWDSGLASVWQPGEVGASERLEAFTEQALGNYDHTRNLPGVPGTSRLSPHLHFGEISPARIIRALQPSGELPEGRAELAWVRELAWRDFSHNLLYHYDHTPERPLDRRFERFLWRNRAEYEQDLHAWQNGRTGVPLVDAGMRELWHSGWMHNRVRMVVASFLTKNLRIPWQEGARWFWDTLIDADLANNTQGWQWTAGCGADAAPYFRVFNPLLQGEKFDPQGAYVQRWCPELKPLDPALLHRPQRWPAHPPGYPKAIVDLKASRERALEAYRAITG